MSSSGRIGASHVPTCGCGTTATSGGKLHAHQSSWTGAPLTWRCSTKPTQAATHSRPHLHPTPPPVRRTLSAVVARPWARPQVRRSAAPGITVAAPAVSRIVDAGMSANTAMAHTAWSSAVVLRIAVDLVHALAPRPALPTRRGLFVPAVRAQPPLDDGPLRPDVLPSSSSCLFGLPEPQDSECLPRQASRSSLPAPPAIVTEHHSFAFLHASLGVPAGSSNSVSPMVSPPASGSVTAASSLPPLTPASAISPIVLPALATELQHHPDKSFSQYLLSGFTDGFRVGFQPALVPQLHSASSNMRSALQNPQVVNAYLAREAQIGRIPGPFPCLDSALSPSVAALASGDSSWTYPSQLGIALTTASTGRTSPCHMPDTTQTYKALTLRELLGQWLVFMFPHCRHVRRW